MLGKLVHESKPTTEKPASSVSWRSRLRVFSSRKLIPVKRSRSRGNAPVLSQRSRSRNKYQPGDMRLLANILLNRYSYCCCPSIVSDDDHNFFDDADDDDDVMFG